MTAAVLFALAGGGLWWALPAIASAIVDLVPFETERKIGDNLLATVPWKYCGTPAGVAALDDLTGKLSTSHRDMPLSVRVVDFSLVNAFALPGGQIVILRGLLDQARSSDELAGVLAHEMTHSFKRHSLKGLVASSGMSLLFEIATGGSGIGNLGQFALGQSFTRSMEAEADAGAIELLRGAHIATSGFADFFDRLAEHDSRGGLPPFLMSHPDLKERSTLARGEKIGDATPALAADQWTALKGICAVKGS